MEIKLLESITVQAVATVARVSSEGACAKITNINAGELSAAAFMLSLDRICKWIESGLCTTNESTLWESRKSIYLSEDARSINVISTHGRENMVTRFLMQGQLKNASAFHLNTACEKAIANITTNASQV